MAWSIRFTKAADKSLRKLDKIVSLKIFNTLEEIAKLDDPRTRGKALQYNMGGLWRYRVGDYRIICSIENNELVILIIDIEHRSKVYKNK